MVRPSLLMGTVRTARVAAAGAALSLMLLAPSAHAGSGTLAATGCAPQAAAADGTMVFNVRESNGLWNPHIGDAGCNGPALLPAHDGMRGAADITADGRYVLLVTAVGWDRRTFGSEPGQGSQNAIQLFDRRSGRLSTLVPSACTGCSRGVIWPKLSPDGRRITWGQMVRTPMEAPITGAWELHVADVDLAAGTISNNRSWRDPSTAVAIYEPYGWIPGSDRVVFMSTVRSSATGVKRMQLFTLPDSLPAGQAPTRISPQIAPSWKWQKPSDAYHEFVHFRRDDPNTLYTSVGTNTVGGADLFAYDLRSADASGRLGQPRRITYFGGDLNADWAAKAVAGWEKPRYAVVGGLAFVGDRIVTSVCRDVACNKQDAYTVTP